MAFRLEGEELLTDYQRFIGRPAEEISQLTSDTSDKEKYVPDLIHAYATARGTSPEIVYEGLVKAIKERRERDAFKPILLSGSFTSFLLAFLEDGKSHPIDEMYRIFGTDCDPKTRLNKEGVDNLVEMVAAKRIMPPYTGRFGRIGRAIHESMIDERQCVVMERGGDKIRIGPAGRRILQYETSRGNPPEKLRRMVNLLYKSPNPEEIYTKISDNIGLVMEAGADWVRRKKEIEDSGEMRGDGTSA